MLTIILIITFIASIAGSISGVGSGVIVKPVLDALCDYSASTINLLSGTTVLAMTIASLIRSRSHSVKIDSSIGTPLAIGSAIGGILGKLLFSMVIAGSGNDQLVEIIQNLVLASLTLLVLLYLGFKARIRTIHIHHKIGSVMIGLVLGVVSAFLGIGGGPINIIVLCFFFSMDSKSAALNSLYIILFSQVASILFSLVTGSLPPLSWLLLEMIVCGVGGALVGSIFTRKMTHRAVDVVSIAMMAVVIGLSLFNAVKFLIQ